MKILIMILLSITLAFSAIDINTADKQELMTLKGIGSKKADAIIQHRKDSCFVNIKSLMAVKGIGPKFLEINQKNLTASKCKK